MNSPATAKGGRTFLLYIDMHLIKWENKKIRKKWEKKKIMREKFQEITKIRENYYY